GAYHLQFTNDIIIVIEFKQMCCDWFRQCSWRCRLRFDDLTRRRNKIATCNQCAGEYQETKVVTSHASYCAKDWRVFPPLQQHRSIRQFITISQWKMLRNQATH